MTVQANTGVDAVARGPQPEAAASSEAAPSPEAAAVPDEPGCALAAAVGSSVALEGELRRSRSGALRVVQVMTGVALLLWLLRALLALLGYRRKGFVRLHGRIVELRSVRRLMGLRLGETYESIPLAAIRRVALSPRVGSWAIWAGGGAVVAGAAAGATVCCWGLRGREPSWVLLGAFFVLAGVLLDGLAYLWSQRAARRELVMVELLLPGSRIRLCSPPRAGAERLAAEVARIHSPDSLSA